MLASSDIGDVKEDLVGQLKTKIIKRNIQLFTVYSYIAAYKNRSGALGSKLTSRKHLFSLSEHAFRRRVLNISFWEMYTRSWQLIHQPSPIILRLSSGFDKIEILADSIQQCARRQCETARGAETGAKFSRHSAMPSATSQNRLIEEINAWRVAGKRIQLSLLPCAFADFLFTYACLWRTSTYIRRDLFRIQLNKILICYIIYKILNDLVILDFRHTLRC